MNSAETTHNSTLPADLPAHLLAWYDKCRRILPWREDPTPYHVWVSEIMLQQTRVEAVIPYYERFLRELPDVASLAGAPEERLLKLWEGLGYYSRVRNMQKAAIQIMELYDGQLPSEPAQLIRLSGIGAYTAAAIASIAFQYPAVSVDGNLMRVYARLIRYGENIAVPSAKKAAEQAYLEVLPKDRPGDMNQALMDLGATVCLPSGTPLCGKCPLQTLCAAHAQGCETSIPIPKEKTARRVRKCTVLIVRDGERVLLHKRPKKGLLAGLYEFPNVDGVLTEQEARQAAESYGFSVTEITPLPPARHVFTHLVWEMTGYSVRIETSNGAVLPEDCMFIFVDQMRKNAALPSAFSAYSDLL